MWYLITLKFFRNHSLFLVDIACFFLCWWRGRRGIRLDDKKGRASRRQGGAVKVHRIFGHKHPNPFPFGGNYTSYESWWKEWSLFTLKAENAGNIPVHLPLQLCLRCRSHQWDATSSDFGLWGCDIRYHGLWLRWEQGILVGAGTSGDAMVWMLLRDRGQYPRLEILHDSSILIGWVGLIRTIGVVVVVWNEHMLFPIQSTLALNNSLCKSMS